MSEIINESNNRVDVDFFDRVSLSGKIEEVITSLNLFKNDAEKQGYTDLILWYDDDDDMRIKCTGIDVNAITKLEYKIGELEKINIKQQLVIDNLLRKLDFNNI